MAEEVINAQPGLTDADSHLIVAFAGCSLDESPGSNWVQEQGGLPDYICRVAKAVRKTGKTTSEAIAIAVSRIKVWATGKGVDKDTQAKAVAALAEWEKKKAKSHADNVKASAAAPEYTMSDAQLLLLVKLTPPCHQTATDKVLLKLTKK